MGEAKRRRQLDAHWGKSTQKKQIEKTLRYVKNRVANSLLEQPQRNIIGIILTNKDQGYEPDFIEQFQSAIRDHQFPCEVSIWILPRQYASLPDSEAFDKLVRVY